MSYSLLIFIIATAFIVLKVFASLNSRNHKQAQFNSGIATSLGSTSQPKFIVQYPISSVDFDTTPWQEALIQIQKWDPNFSWGVFAYQVKWLHDKVLQSFTNSDARQLHHYLKNEHLLESFAKKINTQIEQNLTQHTETILSQIQEIKSVTFDLSKVIINVHLFDRFISFIQDSNYNLVEGSKKVQAQNWIWTVCGAIRTTNMPEGIDWTILDIQKI